MKTREECEAKITAYLEAVHDGDDTAADFEAVFIDELLGEYLLIPKQRRSP